MRGLASVLWLAFGVAGCGRDCGVRTGERRYEFIEGAVRVELVRDVRWVSGGRGPPYPENTFYVRVHTQPVINEPVTCDHVDLAENADGSVIAFRCRGTAPWSVVRVLGGGRWLRECDAPIGVSAHPAFEHLAPLSLSARRIAFCVGAQGVPAVWQGLIRAITEREGGDRAADVVASLAEDRWPPEQPYILRPDGSVVNVSVQEDPWPEAFGALAEGARPRARRLVCEGLTRVDASPSLYARAAARCPFDAPGVGEGASRALRRFLLLPPPSEACTAATAIRWAGAIGAVYDPRGAGAVACERLTSQSQRYGSYHPEDVTIGVLALTRTQCPAAGAWITGTPCGAYLDCDGGLCTQAELDRDFDPTRQLVATPPSFDSPRPSPRDFGQGRSQLALAYAQGPFPREFMVRNDRRRYATARAGLHACQHNDLPRGTPCNCTDQESIICDTPTGEVRVVAMACAFTIDDAHRRILDVRSVCQDERGSCDAGRECCPGLTCSGGPTYVCQAPILDASMVPIQRPHG